ncbi:hypothetical protein EDD37DRAFT_654955 [Exophiala viscosa]|nr:hypothetical protein EDD37DRAFT_654955 [Exophiala viscosa]
MTKRIKSRPEDDGSPSHYHFHGSITNLFLNSNVNGLNQPPATSTREEEVQPAREELREGLDISLKRSCDDAGIDDDILAMDNGPAANEADNQAEDEMSAAGEDEMNEALSTFARRLAKQRADGDEPHDMTRSPVICTVPRGGDTYLLKLPYPRIAPNPPVMSEYANNLHILKNILQTDQLTTLGFRLSEGSVVDLVSNHLECLLPERVYTEALLAAMLEVLSTPKNLFVLAGWEVSWKHLSSDTERVWFVQYRQKRWTALCMLLQERKSGNKRLQFALYDPENAFADEPSAFAASKAMSELRDHAKWSELTRWHEIQHIGTVQQVECPAPDEDNCSGPRVLHYLLESRPMALSPRQPPTHWLRAEHFALLHGILSGDGASEIVL